MWESNLKKYDAIVALTDKFERKGKTMPYTSSNGYMFSLLNKSGEFGIRLSKEDQTIFKEKYNTTIFKSYGPVMKDYVLVPDNLLDDQQLILEYLEKSYAFVHSLPTK